MGYEEIINIFMNNSIAVACLIYFMWFNNTTLKELTNTMSELVVSVKVLVEKVNIDK